MVCRCLKGSKALRRRCKARQKAAKSSGAFPRRCCVLPQVSPEADPYFEFFLIQNYIFLTLVAKLFLRLIPQSPLG